MGLDLPEILDRYFQAQNRHDVEAMVACFATDARVRDEGRDILGTEAIRDWKQATSRKYRVAVEPLEADARGDRTVVVAKVSGSFEGSPARLTYRFNLSKAGRIARLEVG